MTLEDSIRRSVLISVYNYVDSPSDYAVKHTVNYRILFYVNSDVWSSVYEAIQQADRFALLIFNKIKEH
jgi:hypothetical protein